MSYTHGIRNLRISGILISSPYNGGNRLHLLLYDFRQLLKGEFHNFLPLLLSNQQFSVLRSGCTIPYHCILLITLFGFFEMNIRLNHSLQIYCKRFNHMSVGATGFEPATSRPPAVHSNQTEPHPVVQLPFFIIQNFPKKVNALSNKKSGRVILITPPAFL